MKVAELLSLCSTQTVRPVSQMQLKSHKRKKNETFMTLKDHVFCVYCSTNLTRTNKVVLNLSQGLFFCLTAKAEIK